MAAPQVVTRNPNASLAGSLSAISTLLVYLASTRGVHLNTTQAVAFGGAVTTGGLWLGRAGGKAVAFFAKRGICGLARLIWRGEGT